MGFGEKIVKGADLHANLACMKGKPFSNQMVIGYHPILARAILGDRFNL